MNVALPVGGSAKFFRVAERSLTGSLGLTNGQALSGIVTAAVATASVGARVQYAALYDVSEGRTNKLGWLDLLREPPQFALNSALLKSGMPHSLFLFLVDDVGDVDTSDSVRMTYTEPVVVYPQNPISLNGFGDTERMFYLSFSTVHKRGTWSVEVSDALGSPVWSWSGDLESSRNARGEIVAKDDRAVPYQGYDPAVFGTHFLVRVTVRPVGAPMETLSAISKIRSRAPRMYCLVEEVGRVVSPADIRPNLDGYLAATLQAMSFLGDSHFAVSGATSLFGAEEWNILADTETWNAFADVLATNCPSHLYSWTAGGPVRLGSAFGANINAASLRGGPVASLVVIDGCNAAFGVLDALLDASGSDLSDVLEKGKFPRCGVTFVGIPFSGMVTDSSVNHTAFMNELIGSLYAASPYAFGLRGKTCREVLEDLFIRYPDMRSRVRLVGYPDCFVDE